MSQPRARKRRTLRSVQVRLAGLPVIVVSEAEMANVDYVAGLLDQGPASVADDVHTTCHFCNRPIRHRPYMPAAVTKICGTCADDLTREAA